MAAQEAGVVVRDGLAVDGAGGGRDRRQLLLLHQPVEQLGVVHDLELDAELGVLVLQRVEAVGAGGDDLLDLRLLEHLGVLHGQLHEEELVAGAARRVAGAGLAVTEDGEVDAGHVQQLGDGLGGLLLRGPRTRRRSRPRTATRPRRGSRCRRRPA